MTIWRIQLKDNRDGGKNKDNRDKFDFCFSNKIIGIGWCDINDCEKGVDPTFDKAKEEFEKIEVGDLVWTKVPNEKIYYLCKVIPEDNTNKEKIKFSEFAKFDVNEKLFKYVKFSKPIPLEYLNINYESLIIRSTVQKITNHDVIDMTKEIAEEYLCEKS